MCVLLELCAKAAQPSHWIFRRYNALKFNGPLNVKATPNLAVLVGKTQSAWQFAAQIGIEPKHDNMHHIDPQSNAYQ